MILCTGCGTRNPDDAQTCQSCDRKLQSRWAAQGCNGAGAGLNGPYDLDSMGGDMDFDALRGQGRAEVGGDSGWRPLPPAQITIDPNAAKLMHACMETWTYALLLIIGTVTTAVSEDWRYVAGTLVVAAGLAWARGI
jgi:hypothetical protein